MADLPITKQNIPKNEKPPAGAVKVTDNSVKEERKKETKIAAEKKDNKENKPPAGEKNNNNKAKKEGEIRETSGDGEGDKNANTDKAKNDTFEKKNPDNGTKKAEEALKKTIADRKKRCEASLKTPKGGWGRDAQAKRAAMAKQVLINASPENDYGFDIHPNNRYSPYKCVDCNTLDGELKQLQCAKTKYMSKIGSKNIEQKLRKERYRPTISRICKANKKLACSKNALPVHDICNCDEGGMKLTEIFPYALSFYRELGELIEGQTMSKADFEETLKTASDRIKKASDYVEARKDKIKEGAKFVAKGLLSDARILAKPATAIAKPILKDTVRAVGSVTGLTTGLKSAKDSFSREDKLSKAIGVAKGIATPLGYGLVKAVKEQGIGAFVPKKSSTVEALKAAPGNISNTGKKIIRTVKKTGRDAADAYSNQKKTTKDAVEAGIARMGNSAQIIGAKVKQAISGSTTDESETDKKAREAGQAALVGKENLSQEQRQVIAEGAQKRYRDIAKFAKKEAKQNIGPRETGETRKEYRTRKKEQIRSSIESKRQNFVNINNPNNVNINTPNNETET